MKFLLAAITIMIVSCPLFSQEISKKGNVEINTVVSMLLYQSVFSYQESFAFETALRGHIVASWDWQFGARIGFDPTLPEGFVRLLAAPEVGAWCPFVGIELGFTNRARFDEGENLLRETRAAMERDISHCG